MGNRGTTPSWDEEQIAKFGFEMHYASISAPFRRRQARRNAELVDKHIESVLAQLGDTTDETRARASFAIPEVLSALFVASRGGARDNWREWEAFEIYENWFRRTNQMGPVAGHFRLLKAEVFQPFLDIVDAVISVGDE